MGTLNINVRPRFKFSLSENGYAIGPQGPKGDAGDSGKSAYQSYLETTSDNPPKSESEWSSARTAVATTSANGLMSSDDKSKVDNLGSISTKNFWSGTKAQYDALGTYDPNTLYYYPEPERILYGTGDAPSPTGLTEGTVYFKYTM